MSQPGVVLSRRPSCQAVAAAEVQAYRHLPVTPVESVAWLNRLNQEMWQPFWQPFLLANNLSSWQVRGWQAGHVTHDARAAGAVYVP